MTESVPALLRELHRIRKQIQALQDEIDRGPRIMKTRQQRLAAEEQAHRDAYDQLKRLKLQQKEDEGTLKQIEQRLAKLQADIHSAASKKEFDAKSAEIQFAQTQKGELEDRILLAMTEIEERTAKLPEVDQRWSTVQAEFAAFQKEAQERLERLITDQKAAQALLKETEDKLPRAILPQYERLIKSYGPDGLAAVQGRTCQHCRTTLTEQARNNLLGGAFVCCPNCGRGLYLVE